MNNRYANQINKTKLIFFKRKKKAEKRATQESKSECRNLDPPGSSGEFYPMWDFSSFVSSVW